MDTLSAVLFLRTILRNASFAAAFFQDDLLRRVSTDLDRPGGFMPFFYQDQLVFEKYAISLSNGYAESLCPEDFCPRALTGQVELDAGSIPDPLGPTIRVDSTKRMLC